MGSGEEEVGKKMRSKDEKSKQRRKFFVDLANDKEHLKLVSSLLFKCNQKSFGREILFRDLCIYAIGKLKDKDLEKIQEVSLSKMEKVDLARKEHNLNAGTNLSIEDFLIKKLGIN